MRPDTAKTLGKNHCDHDLLQERFFRMKATRRCLALLGGLQPKDGKFFLRAFTHASFVHEHPHLNLEDYQRLEFLGDSAISLYVADKLCTLFPDMREGELSRLRSSLVCKESLAGLSRFLGLENMILLGKGTECSPSLLCDVFEALVGSIHCDRGFEATCRILDHLFEVYRKETGETLIHPQRMDDFDNKSRLQELTLKLYGETPEYRHQKVDEHCFRVELWIAGRLLGSARQTSKKEAEKTLATKALNEKFYHKISTNGVL